MSFNPKTMSPDYLETSCLKAKGAYSTCLVILIKNSAILDALQFLLLLLLLLLLLFLLLISL